LFESSLFLRINVVLFSNIHLSELLGKIMVIPIKFERVQWPVGHGGFHTGQLRVENADFKYFYDCGALKKVDKELIRKKLESTSFDFGVISHFDFDHYSEIDYTKVKVLFLPYLTPTDMVFHALMDMFENNLPTQSAIKGIQILNSLPKTIRLVMVNGPTLEKDQTEDKKESAPQEEDEKTDLNLHIPGVFRTKDGYECIQHNKALEVRHDSMAMLFFKFFNHRQSEVFKTFSANLYESITLGKLNRPQVDPAAKQKPEATPYTTLDDFLEDIKSGNVQAIDKNSGELKLIYEVTLENFKAGRITASNLSSLNMFGRTVNWPYSQHISRTKAFVEASSFVNRIDRDENGWMLTGDLELTETIWPDFKNHYFHEISQCAVLNVPHHGSADSLCEEAVACMRNNIFVMPVKSNDDKHPALILRDRLERHKVQKRQCVTSASESGISFTTLGYLRKFHP
jgi:hypothetical protein